MKKGSAIVLAALLLVCLCVLPGKSRADLGDFSGGSDYGGSDWGSSSSDWGSSDWGSSSSYSSGSSYHSSSSSGDVECGDILGTFVLIAIVCLVMLAKNSRKGRSGQTAAAPRPQGAQRTAGSKLRPLSEYAKLDPNFSAQALREKLANVYVQMQQGCTAKDITLIRPYFTDTLYQQFDRQIKGLIRTHRTNYVDRISVLSVTLRGFYQEGGQDHLIAELRTRITDYTLDDDTGKLVSGSQTAEKFMTYEYALSRPTGTLTEAAAEVTQRHCPNCGAPLSVNESAKCPYCDMVVTFSSHDWTIYAIKGISQVTRG